MIGAIVSFGLWLLGLITGKKKPSAEERLGVEETTNAQLREGQQTIEAANAAAKKVQQEAADETYDPNNRDDPRNAGQRL